MNNFYDSDLTTNDFKDYEFSDIVNDFIDDLKDSGYDGDNDLNSMKWFIKGLKLPPPSIQRYDQSPEFKLNQQKGKDKLNELMNSKTPLQLDDKILNSIKNFNKNFLRPLPPKQFKTLPRYDQSEEYLNKLDNILLKREEIKSYTQWKQFEAEDQNAEVEKIMNKLERNPTKWIVDFKPLNAKSKLDLLSRLKDFFETYISELQESKQYKFSFEVFGKWYSKPFTPELYRVLMDNFTKLHFVYDFGEPLKEYISNPEINEIPEWSYFTAIGFSKQTKDELGNNDRGGHFFKYLVENITPGLAKYLKRLQIFESLTIKGKVRKELNDCCFVYALKQSNIPLDVINKIKLAINTRYLSPNKIHKLFSNNLIHCLITYIEEGNGKNTCQKLRSLVDGKRFNYLGVPKKQAKYIVNLACFEEHFFVEEKSPFSTYFIDHYDEICKSQRDEDRYYDKRYNIDHWRKSNSFATSSHIVRALFKQNHFRRIKYGEYNVMQTVFYDEVKKDIDYDLQYEESEIMRITPISDSYFMDNINEIFYADFESDVTKENHKPFMCCVKNADGDISKTFIGEDCAEQFLEFLPHKSLVYFHNLTYDIRMFAHLGIIKSVIKGTKTLSAEIEYGTLTFFDKRKKKQVSIPKKIFIKDSLAILNCKLVDLPNRFNLSNIQKELFPYKYYSLERLASNIGIIDEAGENEDKQWSKEDYETFNANIDSIPNCRLSPNTFNMILYAEFYCQQDVEVLRLSFNKFQRDFYKEFKINIFNELTISGIANNYFRKMVYEKNGNLYEYSGHVQHFIQKAVRGGRCMTAFNKKWHVNLTLADFDAVSLYPSAMARLYTVEDAPKVIQPDQLNLNFLSKQSAYVVDIKITKVNKHYAFPLIVQKIDGLNVNDDNLQDPITITIDNIGLEDLIQYQQIEFEFLRGYYWDGKKDYRIQEVIKNIFNKRLEYKALNNPLQELYKLIMNSCYGKTIQKPVKYEHRYIKEEKLSKYWYKNYYKIIECSKLANSNIYDVKIIKQINDQFNFTLLGVQVLSMSKRIMNEVMCLAYDLGIKIFYQDTDSMHIENSELPRLAAAYKEKFNRELIGKGMGQFHSDFEPIKKEDDEEDKKETPLSIESYFIAKKIYIDKLTDSTKAIDYHVRGKGLTKNSIKHLAKTSFNNNFMNLYKALYNAETLTFDLTAGQPSFKFSNDFTVSSRKEFLRRIKVNLEEGIVDQYFNY
ncbi:MAG: hypothetical protein IJZ77_04190 [Bacilli bacterium]|nr:hypothetical protein [Bacilli bacterium]